LEIILDDRLLSANAPAFKRRSLMDKLMVLPFLANFEPTITREASQLETLVIFFLNPNYE
jgi:hypothetical protein